MTTIVYRSVKGSPLTNNEIDTNFSNINTDIGLKAPISNPTLEGTVTVSGTIKAGLSSRYGLSLLGTCAPTDRNTWYRVATFVASNTPVSADIRIGSLSRHTNIVIRIGRGTGDYSAEIFRNGFFGYAQRISNVRVVDMGINSVTYVDVKFGDADSATYYYIDADIRSSSPEILVLNDFINQGTSTAGQVYNVYDVIRSFGGISCGQAFILDEAGVVTIPGTIVSPTILALRNSLVVTGTLPGFDYRPTGGTAGQPQYMWFNRLSEVVLIVLEWGTSGGANGNVTRALFYYAANESHPSWPALQNGTYNGMYDAAGKYICNITYDTNGDVISVGWSAT